MARGERVTVVVEQEALRLLCARNGIVTRWGSAPLSRGVLSEQGAVADPEGLALVLRRLWANQNISQEQSPPQAILAIPGHAVSTAIVPLTGMDVSEPAVLNQQAKAAFPEPDLYLAWQQVGSPGAPALFVVAASMALIDSYVAALERAELGVLAVDVKPLALIRGIGQRHAIIVDAERALGTVIIVDEALPRRVRFQTLALPLLISPEEKVMRLADVLYRVVEQFNRDATNRPLHPGVPVFLTGSLSDHPFLVDVVRQVLRRPLGQVSPPLKLPPDLPATQFLANVGLATKRL